MAESHIVPGPRTALDVINEWIDKEFQPVNEDHVIMGMLKAKGRQVFNKTATKQDWDVEYRRREPIPGDGAGGTESFTPTNTKVRATLPYRMYYLNEVVTKFEKLATRAGSNVRRNTLDDTLKGAMRNFRDAMPEQLYNDGDSATSDYNKRWHGLESIFSQSGVPANAWACTCDDTYAGLSTAQGYYGSWTAPAGHAWPHGSGQMQYHYNTPLVCDYGSTEFSATATWAANWRNACKHTASFMRRLHANRPDIWLFDSEMEMTARTDIETNETFEVTQNSEPVKLGFANWSLEGIPVVSEYGVPDGVGYLLTFRDMELASMQSQLIVAENEKDMQHGGSTLIRLDTYSNLFIRMVAHQAKLQLVTT